MRRKIMSVVCAAVIMSVAVMGCSKEDSVIVPVEESTEELVIEEESEEPAGLSEEEEQKLYNTYIDINNVMVGRYYDVLDRYFKYVDDQEEFMLLGDYYSGISLISSFYESMDQADELLSRKTERTEVDDAYAALSPVMRELALALDEVSDYTDDDGYEKDDFAKGKELHAIIWNDYHEYEVLGENFLNKLGAVASEKRADDMAELEAEGYVVTYAIMKMVSTAQEIQAAIYEQGIDDSTMLELDIETLQPLYDQYMEDVQMVQNYLTDENTMMEEGYPVRSAYFQSFKDAVGKSKEELEEIFEHVGNQTPVSAVSITNAFIVSGTPSGFDSKVSAIISNYNTMRGY